jgi:hypothetical protein
MEIANSILGYLKGEFMKTELGQSANAIQDKARDEAVNSGLPGHIDGPNDALRHIIGAAEVVRQHGELIGRAILEANELDGSYARGADNQNAASAGMDRHNNAIGIEIGKSAKSYEEIVERAKAEIAKGIENGASGKDGSAKWLDPSQWKDANGKPDTRPIPENFGKPPQSGDAESEAEPRALRTNAILRKPGGEWSEDEARHVMGDPRYWDSRRRDPELIERVTDSYRQRYDKPQGSAGGPVEVDAYTRGDGVSVAAHSRAAPKRGSGAADTVSEAQPLAATPRAKPLRGNRPPPRRRGRV